MPEFADRSPEARLLRQVAAAVPAGVERWPVEDEAAWHARRAQDVTASVAGALLGAHEFTTYYGLYWTKLGFGTSDADSPAMRRGRLLEDDALQVLREDNPGWVVVPGGHYYRHVGSRLGGTPDAFVFDPARPGFGVAQVKSVEPSIFRTKWLAEDDGVPVPPLWIVVQVLTEAWLCGASWAAVTPIVVGHGVEVPVLPVEPHPRLIAKLQAESQTFWARIAADDSPPPDFRSDGATIAGLFPDDNGEEVDLTGANDLPVLAAELDELALRIAADKARRDEIRNAFRHALGPHEAALIGDGRRVTLRTQRRAAKWVEGGTSRVLRIGKVNDGR